MESPGAGLTSTRSWVMSSIRQLDAPSANTSPTRDSYTISSSSSPTRRPGPGLPTRLSLALRALFSWNPQAGRS